MEQKPARSAFDREASMALKGIAILMMVYHHCFRVANLYEGQAVSFFPFGEQQVVNAAFARKICVSIFAFISGYGLFLSYQNYAGKGTATRWCTKRYAKTFSGYWLVWVLSAVILQIVDGRTGRILLRDGGYRGFLYGLIHGKADARRSRSIGFRLRVLNRRVPQGEPEIAARAGGGVVHDGQTIVDSDADVLARRYGSESCAAFDFIEADASCFCFRIQPHCLVFEVFPYPVIGNDRVIDPVSVFVKMDPARCAFGECAVVCGFLILCAGCDNRSVVSLLQIHCIRIGSDIL